jgi:hypothetical protein
MIWALANSMQPLRPSGTGSTDTVSSDLLQSSLAILRVSIGPLEQAFASFECYVFRSPLFILVCVTCTGLPRVLRTGTLRTSFTKLLALRVKFEFGQEGLNGLGLGGLGLTLGYTTHSMCCFLPLKPLSASPLAITSL